MRHPAVLLVLGVSAVPTFAGLAAALWLGLDAGAMQRVLQTPGAGLSIASSLWTGLVASALALIVSHLAVALAVTGGWRDRLGRLLTPLLAMPHLAIGIGLALLIAPSGLLLRLVSPWLSGFELPPDWLSVQDPWGLGLIAGLVIKESCFLIFVLFAALAQVPATRLQQQATSLGYGRLKAWLVAVAPLLQQQIRLPVAAVIVFGITNVELAVPLGPGLPPTWSVILWRWFIDPDPAIHAQAYAGTLLLLLIATLAVVIAAGIGRFAKAGWRAWAVSGARQVHERGVRAGLVTVLVAAGSLGALALLAILLRSFSGTWRFPSILPANDFLSGWHIVWPAIESVAGTTVLLAALTALVGVALVLPAAECLRDNAKARYALGVWLFVPLILPQMTYLFGMQVLLAWLHLDGTLIAVLWAHLLFALPYLWALLAHARATIDPRYEAMARTLGATRGRSWLTVTAPLMTRATVLALALAFSISVALYLPSLFAGAGRIATAATEAAAAAGSGSLRLAAIQSILLALAPLAVFAAAFSANALMFRNRRDVPR